MSCARCAKRIKPAQHQCGRHECCSPQERGSAIFPILVGAWRFVKFDAIRIPVISLVVILASRLRALLCGSVHLQYSGCVLLTDEKLLGLSMVQINFHNTHSYPGCRATVLFGRVTRICGVAMVEFSDGSVAHGRYRRMAEDELILHISAYATTRKRTINAKSWRLKRIDNHQIWKVVAKLTRRKCQVRAPQDEILWEGARAIESVRAKPGRSHGRCH